MKRTFCDGCGKPEGTVDHMDLWLDANRTAVIQFGNLFATPHDLCPDCLSKRIEDLRKALEKWIETHETSIERKVKNE